MDIEFSVSKPHLWLQNIADILKIEIRDSSISLPIEMGEGFIKQLHFGDEFTLNYLNIKLNRSLNFVRNAGKEITVSPIFFYLNKSIFEQNINNNYVRIGLKSENGIFWPSNQVESKWTIPANEWVSNITIAVFHKWIIDNLGDEKNNYIHHLIIQNQPYYIFEEITARMLPVIDALETTIQNSPLNGLSKLYIKSKTLELISLFFEKLTNRHEDNDLRKIYPGDIEKMFLIKNNLFENFSDDISIHQLASDHCMSSSKLQKLFKHVFGKSIYKYLIEIRMLQAKSLLESGKYSVSEAGHKIGSLL